MICVYNVVMVCVVVNMVGKEGSVICKILGFVLFYCLFVGISVYLFMIFFL